MTIISYAQNYEDVMLWRALKHIDNGFYIDVGANDPNIHSVTNLFYKKGWCGINIEPLSAHYSDLLMERTKDINLYCAAGSRIGELEIWECDIRGWATANKSVIKQHINAGKKGKYHSVPIYTLEKICNENVSDDIHFLKIDVEGLEEDVIKGNNWMLHRPWIVVVESTVPNSQIESFSSWEPILLDSKYSLAYADGLNRFYVSDEHKELLNAFKYPPNVFDEFVLASQLEAETRTLQAEAEASQAEAKTKQAETKAEQAEAKAEHAEAGAEQACNRAESISNELSTVYNSRSWRITLPLRWITRQFRLLKQQGISSRIKALVNKTIRPPIQRLITHIDSNARFRNFIVVATSKIGLYHLMRSIYRRLTGQPQKIAFRPHNGMSQKYCTVDDLTPYAKDIYNELTQAINIEKNK